MDDGTFYQEIARTFILRRQSIEKKPLQVWREVHDDVREKEFNADDEFEIHQSAYEQIFEVKLER